MLIEYDSILQQYGDVKKVYIGNGILKSKSYEGKNVLNGMIEFPNAKYWMTVYKTDVSLSKADYNVVFAEADSKEKVGKANGFDNGYYNTYEGTIGETKVTLVSVKMKKRDKTFYWRVYVLSSEENAVAEDVDDEVPFAVKDAPKTKLEDDGSADFTVGF